jgi:dCTP deaminase
MILADVDLKQYMDSGRLKINPFTGETIRENGLDLRFGKEFAILKRQNDEALDTRGIDNVNRYFDVYTDVPEFVIPPHSRCLTHTLETIELPHDLMGFCELRSSYARSGLSIPPTAVDAGFEGQLTIEITGSSFPVKVYPLDRFLHLVFSKLTNFVTKPYIGNYQKQKGIRLPSFPK